MSDDVRVEPFSAEDLAAIRAHPWIGDPAVMRSEARLLATIAARDAELTELHGLLARGRDLADHRPCNAACDKARREWRIEVTAALAKGATS